MEIINDINQMQKRAEALRNSGKTIAFVPTMGYLHDGHLALMRAGRELGDVLVVSIFVNPAQFGPKEDFGSYPRDLERDSALCRQVGVDIIFHPAAEAIYPRGFQTHIEVENLSRGLCGDFRPGHFRGVATVVAKLFNIIKPHAAVFGEKDCQQLAVIRRMTADLNLDVQIVGYPTVRETDGLAMSSRNTFLSAAERQSALSLSRSLEQAQQMVREGERAPGRIEQAVRETISREPATEIEYVRVCHPESLSELKWVEDSTLLALAVRVGKTRLIDNRIITTKPGRE
ncbi:MAG: pantoate--beta-alanine ligase [Proteobacteria bacterium]|nr:pantoate--beta-alanine ligase [Pseudomonadota bacterium]